MVVLVSIRGVDVRHIHISGVISVYTKLSWDVRILVNVRRNARTSKSAVDLRPTRCQSECIVTLVEESKLRQFSLRAFVISKPTFTFQSRTFPAILNLISIHNNIIDTHE